MAGSVAGREAVGNRFYTLAGRSATGPELDELAPLYETHGWDALDARIMAVAQRAPARSDPDPDDALPSARGAAAGIPWVLIALVAIVAYFAFFRK